MSPCFATATHGRLDRLTSQARSVRGHVSRRARHASGDSPWHSSAKHHILEACFFRMTPFRSMLLTVQSGLHSLAPRAQSVPAYAQVLRHSSIALHGAPEFSGGVCHHSAKASGSEDLDIEEPVSLPDTFPTWGFCT